MYSREQKSQLRQAFWKAFGQYISPQLSAERLKINWINYKTGFKDVHFRMRADQKSASIGIELTHADIEIQALFFQQFVELRNILHDYLEEEWEWLLHTRDENGYTISRIFKALTPVNALDQNDWPQLISFFKPRIIALDAFWSDARYTFDSLK